MDYTSVAFAGVLVLMVVLSAVVALVALRKRLGYWRAFLIVLGFSLLLVVARIPLLPGSKKVR